MPVVYLIPSLLHDEGVNSIPPYIVDAIRDCSVFFAENERTARRYFKKLWPQMVIDNYEWNTIDENSLAIFRKKLGENKNIGIVSEAGCPGIADPGQALVEAAHIEGYAVKPLVGPSSILLALMASGMNGQQFQFLGYLPIESTERKKMIQQIEAESAKKKCTQIFIETPYRNDQLIDALLQYCKFDTRLCIAVDITGPAETIKTMPISQWKKEKPSIHKRLAIFLLLAN